MDSFISTLRSLGPAKLGIMAATTAGSLAFFIYLSSRLAAPEMALLYGDLDSQDSGQIVSRLESDQVSYELSADGSRIFVPSDQVGRIRVAMAEQGLPSGGTIGYEIFDRSEGIGATNFVQKINHLRALEGEIARTIRSVSRIKQARVHLVLPERQLFSRDRQEPSASIVVSLQGRRGLDQQQVVAIQQIVSAAVPGLKPEKVSIVDNAGNLLARSLDRNDTKQLGNTAQELQANYEGRMARMIEEMLGRSLGPGNVRAQVTAEMDFDRVTENSEIFDPDGQVVRSTQTVEESTSESDSQPSGVTVGSNLPGAEIPQLDEGGGSNAQSTRTEETVNFDISRTTRTHIRETGAVRRISVAVMVNGRTVEDANGNSQYEPRSQAEMDQIAAVVRSAVGLDESRGDRIEVVNMPFTEIAPVSEFEAPGLFGIEMADLMRLAEVLVLGILAVLVVIFVVRPMIVRLMASDNLALEGAGVGSLPGGPAMAAALGGPDGDIEAALQDGSIPPARRLPRSDQSRSVAEEIEQMIDINKIEGRVRASSVRKIGEIIQKHPEEAVGIIRNWLYQDA